MKPSPAILGALILCGAIGPLAACEGSRPVVIVSGGSGGSGGDGVGAGTGGAGGAAGAPGVVARVLVGDRDADRLLLHDREGTVLRDLRPGLDLGADATGIVLAVDQQMLPWSEGTAVDGTNLLRDLRARPVRRARSHIVALGHVAAGGAGNGGAAVDRVRIVTTAGDRFAALDVPGPSDDVGLSWQRRFLFVSRLPASAPPESRDGTVIRLADGQVVWQRAALDSAAFAPDDSHLLSTSTTGEAQMTDLATGGSAPAAAGQRGSLHGVAATGGIFGILQYRGTLMEGLALFFLDWSGRSSRFDPNLPPPYGWDTLSLVLDEGQRIVWARGSRSFGAVDPTGFFEFDVRSRTGRKIVPEPRLECLEAPAGFYYQLQDASLLRCPCATGSCVEIAAVPPVPEPRFAWSRILRSFSGERFAALMPQWLSSAVPMGTPPDILFYDADGRLRAQVPAGELQLDAAAGLAVVRSQGEDNTFRIVDLETSRVTAGTARGFAAIVYE
jgi:hypothetical protein